MNPTVTPSKRQLLQQKVDSGQSIFRGGVKPTEIYGNKTPITQAQAGGMSSTDLSKSISPINTQLPDVLPAQSLQGNTSYSDIYAKRNQLEQNQIQTQAETANYNELLNSASSFSGNIPLTDPTAYLNSVLLNTQTDTQEQLGDTYTEKAEALKGFGTDYQQSGIDYRKELGLPDMKSQLAETNNQIAERTKRLREDLRKFETNAAQRGVAREFVQAEKDRITSEAITEIADLSIIQAAQSGNVEAANAEVDRLLAEKEKAFGFQNAAIQSEIDRLTAQNTEESNKRAENLTIALNERTRIMTEQSANEKESRGYLVDAANNGADQKTLDTIRNMIKEGVAPEEVAYVAGPWIGRLDRQQAQASIAASYQSIAASKTNQMLSLAQAGDKNAIKTLGFDPRTIEEEIDPTTKRQLSESVSAQESLLNMASRYKDIIDKYGFTNTVFGDTEIVGETETLRALMTAEYKKAATLGTLDAGVLILMDKILGEEPTSSIFGIGPEGNILTNFTGRKSSKLSSQLDTFINQTQANMSKDMLRLGINPLEVDFSVVTKEDDDEINAFFGINTTTPTGTVFDPSKLFNK